MLEIGILQGRLSPDPDERFQFFPLSWRDEFERARGLGFSHIEWLADWRDAELNPLISGKGLDEIRDVIDRHNVSVRSVCVDYFMKYGFLGNEAAQSRQILKTIIENAVQITAAPIIVIPLLEKHAIVSETDKKEIVHNIVSVLNATNESAARLAFETEMPMPELLDFLARFENPRAGVCYDIGNCTSYGFDCPKDLRLLSGNVFDIHIKDRKVGKTNSMPLGEGDADFHGCFQVLHDIGYDGPITLQAWRGEYYFEDAARQIAFTKRLLSR